MPELVRVKPCMYHLIDPRLCGVNLPVLKTVNASRLDSYVIVLTPYGMSKVIPLDQVTPLPDPLNNDER